PYVIIYTITNYFTRLYAFRWREAMTFAYMPYWKKVDSKVEGATTYPAAQRQHPPRPQAKFFRIQDAIEAEHTAVPRMSKNSIASIVFVDSDLPVSSLQYTNWMPAGPSQAVIYDFGIADSGKFDFSVQFMTGPQFGKVQVLVDGYSLGEVIDCNSDELGVTEVINLGQKRMMARDSHTIGFRSVDEKAVGIDCYLIEKVE
ncbi:MAG: SbmA/BacA-like family transporter, partial [Planctomycetota bacterium]|nr:SbmA/BacA-like family transporter [Planctomycetota bacterium]